MAKFNLAAVLGDMPDVSKSDTTAQGLEQIQAIHIDQLDDDTNNFYAMTGLEDLAANIELIGLQQPLRVRPNQEAEGRHIIVSGHRRRAACRILVDEGKAKFAYIPCIVERENVSEALQELRLIYANSSTRELSGADKARQAERVEMLLYQLKGEGVEFPGRMRDHVAEACKISASKLARLKVIQDKLVEPRFVTEWKSGDLPEQSAYALAKMPAIMQEAIAELCIGKAIPAGWRLEKIEQRGMEHYLSTPATCADGEGCTNGNQFLAKDLEPQKYDIGHCKCCCDCYALTSCKYACRAGKEKAKRQRSEVRAMNKETRDAEKEKKAATAAFVSKFGQRLAAACEGDREVFIAAAAELARKQYETTAWLGPIKNLAFYNGSHLGGVHIPPEDLAALCRQLNVSADYLLGLSDDPLTEAVRQAERGGYDL